jgi:cobalt transporter subunit CbtB
VIESDAARGFEMTDKHTASARDISALLSAETAHRFAAALLALLLGGFLILGTGFAAIPALHNAAHDSRHSFAFPCH